mgnify:CR=1 FL=1
MSASSSTYSSDLRALPVAVARRWRAIERDAIAPVVLARIAETVVGTPQQLFRGGVSRDQ